MYHNYEEKLTFVPGFLLQVYADFRIRAGGFMYSYGKPLQCWKFPEPGSHLTENIYCNVFCGRWEWYIAHIHGVRIEKLSHNGIGLVAQKTVVEPVDERLYNGLHIEVIHHHTLRIWFSFDFHAQRIGMAMNILATARMERQPVSHFPVKIFCYNSSHTIYSITGSVIEQQRDTMCL